jgi:hypothetical protein
MATATTAGLLLANCNGGPDGASYVEKRLRSILAPEISLEGPTAGKKSVVRSDATEFRKQLPR